MSALVLIGHLNWESTEKSVCVCVPITSLLDTNRGIKEASLHLFFGTLTWLLEKEKSIFRDMLLVHLPNSHHSLKTSQHLFLFPPLVRQAKDQTLVSYINSDQLKVISIKICHQETITLNLQGYLSLNWLQIAPVGLQLQITFWHFVKESEKQNQGIWGIS